VSSPPVSLPRVCANGPGRVRHVRARQTPAGVLVLAASIFLVAPAVAQFPIRQLPAGQGSGFRVQGSGQAGQTGQRQDVRSPARWLVSGPGPQTPSTSPTLPAVARITVVEKDGLSYGSGTLVDVRGEFGLVVSNWHVIRDAAGPITAEFPDGFKSPAQVVKTDKDWDLAALSIYRPHATPMPISGVPPQPGEPLTIAGYGSGQWRMSSGRCTQYLAPGVEFPHEMVELAAEARQGDSGGPILNQRGELAGVLFGSGPGYTSGSYGGRVLKFLSAVVPGGAPGNEGQSPSKLPGNQALASADPSGVPQATAVHETNQPPPPAAAPYTVAPYAAAPSPSQDITPLTPVRGPSADPLLTPPPPRDIVDRIGSTIGGDSVAAVDPRVAVTPSHLDLASAPPIANPIDRVATTPTGLTPRVGAAPAAIDVNHAPPEKLLAAIWRHIGGTTLFDQTKTVLAMIGILSIVVVFLRFGSHKERERDEE
jgi:serine protease Do